MRCSTTLFPRWSIAQSQEENGIWVFGRAAASAAAHDGAGAQGKSEKIGNGGESEGHAAGYIPAAVKSCGFRSKKPFRANGFWSVTV